MNGSLRKKEVWGVSGLLVSLILPYILLQQNIVYDIHYELFVSVVQIIRWSLKLTLFSLLNVILYLWTLLVLKRIKRARVLIVVLHVTTVSCQLVISFYYDYFAELPSFLLLTRIPKTLQISSQIYYQLVDWRTWLILGCCPLTIFFSFFLLRSDLHRNTLFRLCSLLICALYTSYEVYNFHRKDIQREFIFGYSYVSSSYGFSYAYALMLADLVKSWHKSPVPYPGKVNRLAAVRPPPRARPTEDFKNVIFIQVESLGTSTLWQRVGDQLVMPFLHSLVPRSVFFANFIAQHSGGGSSDAELAAFLSLLPLRSHSGLRTADYSKVEPLPAVLKQYGYTTVAMHANHRQFFSRGYAYRMLGFDRFYSQRDYRGAARGILAKDLAFLQQSLDKMQTLPQPYFVHLITVQSHGPYHNYAPQTRAKFAFEPTYTALQIDYLCSMHEVDQALEYFITHLEQQQMLANTIVMLFADEHSVFPSPHRHFEHIPLLIMAPELAPRVEHKAGSHLSLASTLAELLGIREGRNWLGDSLLSGRQDRVVVLNDLTTVRYNGRSVTAHQDVRYKTYLDYSRYILE